MQVTLIQDREVDKVQVWEWRGQWFESQAGQANITLFVFKCHQENGFLKKYMTFGLLTAQTWFYIVNKRKNQFGFFSSSVFA